MPEIIEPEPDVGSQLDRAIASYLASKGAGTKDQNFITVDSRERVYPCNVIRAHKSVEQARNSGIEAYQVQIQSYFISANQMGQRHGYLNRLELDKWVGRVKAAMSQVNDGDRDYRATARAITLTGRALYDADSVQHWDMNRFTCSHVHFVGSNRGNQPDDSSLFVVVRNYEIHAVSENVD